MEKEPRDPYIIGEGINLRQHLRSLISRYVLSQVTCFSLYLKLQNYKNNYKRWFRQ